MAARSDTSLAALLLTQRLAETPVAPLKASEYWAVLDAVDDPARLLGAGTSDVATVLGVDAAFSERVVALLDAATALAFRLEELEQTGLRVAASVDPDYPRVLVERLGSNAPPLLYLAGDSTLLSTDLLGVVGSRDVGAQGGEVAKVAASAAAAHGFGVVSGGAKGVDRLAMTATLGAGGRVVAVLADSLSRVLRDAEVRRAIGEGTLCVCTPYKPTAGFTVANAMGRNKIVYGLSRATLVVAAEPESGGTWAGAVEALRQGIAPVLAWTGPGAGPGNPALVDLGAVALDDVGRLFPLPEAGPVPPARSAGGRQLALDV